VFNILSLILGSGESSRLYRELVYRKRLVSEIGCFIDSKEFAGVFYVYTILMPGVSTEDVKIEMDSVIEDIKQHGAKGEEVQKAKNKIEAHFTYRKQTNLYKADMLAHFKTFYDEAELVNTNIKKYLVITLEDIHLSLNEFIRNSNRVVLTYLPRETAN
jgi:zinc protease